MPIYGNTPSDVAAMDRYREAGMAQQGQFWAQSARAGLQDKRDFEFKKRQYMDELEMRLREEERANAAADLNERKFQFDKDRDARRVDLESLQLAGELERLEAQSKLYDYKASGTPTSGIAIEQMRQAERAAAEEAALTEQAGIAENLAGQANEYQSMQDESALLKQLGSRYKTRVEDEDGWFTGRRTAEQIALDAMRKEFPQSITLPKTLTQEDEITSLLASREAAIAGRNKLLEPSVIGGMKSGGVELLRRGPAGQWMPAVTAPQPRASFSFQQPNGELVYRKRQLSGMIDAELDAKPSYMDAWQNGVPLTKESIKELKDRRKESDTRLKAWREELSDVEKRMEESQRQAQEKSTSATGKTQPPLSPPRYDSEADALANGHRPGDVIYLRDPVSNRYRPAQLLP